MSRIVSLPYSEVGELIQSSGKPICLEVKTRKVVWQELMHLLLVVAQARAEHASGDEAAREEGEDRDEEDEEDEEDDEEGECCHHMRAPACTSSEAGVTVQRVLVWQHDLFALGSVSSLSRRPHHDSCSSN